MQVAQIFKALGDPVRLEIVERLAAGELYTIGGLSKGLGISRQGARKHVDVLASAKILHLKPKGRETQVILDKASLIQGRAFIAKLEDQWDQRLLALKSFVEE